MVTLCRLFTMYLTNMALFDHINIILVIINYVFAEHIHTIPMHIHVVTCLDHF